MKARHEAEVAALSITSIAGISDCQATDFVRQVAEHTVDFAVVVALRKELAAVLHCFPELSPVAGGPACSRSYYRGLLPTGHGSAYRLVATLLHSLGNIEAAHATADLIRDWNPRFVVVNGLAGGLSSGEQEFGDVVASDSIVYYELAKVNASGLEHRNRHFPADPTLLEGIRTLANTDWKMHLPPRPDGRKPSSLVPGIHIGPIASGEKVIASAEEAHRLRCSHPDLIAVEMESAGVASAAFSAVRKIGCLTIRAICDFADATKNDHWHEYAARSAASCLRAFLESRPIAPSEGTWPEVGLPVRPPTGRVSLALRKQLFNQLSIALDLEEFKNFCFLIGVDVDELPGDRKSSRARELILRFERRGQLTLLEDATREHMTSLGA